MNMKYFEHLKLIAIALCLTTILAFDAAAQITIPLPGRRVPQKPKSASELLKEEANKTPDPRASEQENDFMLNDFMSYYSHGWLPKPMPAQSIFLFSSLAWIINDANNLTFSSLPRINTPFSPTNPYSNDDDRKPIPRNKTERSGDYYNSEYDDVDIIYEISLPLPAILRVGVGYGYQRGVLFSKDRSLRGLAGDGSGERIPLEEWHTLDMQEHFIKGTVGVKIPIYGAFADMLDTRISSYYYLYLGAQGQYNIFNRAVQHAQLIQPSNDRVYGKRGENVNGTDTLQLWNAPMTTLNTFRIQPEIALGWALSGEASIGHIQAGIALIMELFATLPLQTVTSDTAWRQYIVGGRVAIGWHRRLGQ